MYRLSIKQEIFEHVICNYKICLDILLHKFANLRLVFTISTVGGTDGIVTRRSQLNILCAFSDKKVQPKMSRKSTLSRGGGPTPDPQRLKTFCYPGGQSPETEVKLENRSAST